MKIVVDRMPSSPGDCPFCEGVSKPTCELLHNANCEYFGTIWGCPFFISLEEANKGE